MRHHHATTKPYMMTKFESEALDFAVFSPHAGKDHEQGDLFIRFTSGRLYFYPLVKTSTYVGLMFAESAGKYFNAHIRATESMDKTHDQRLVDAIVDLIDVFIGRKLSATV